MCVFVHARKASDDKTPKSGKRAVAHRNRRNAGHGKSARAGRSKNCRRNWKLTTLVLHLPGVLVPLPLLGLPLLWSLSSTGASLRRSFPFFFCCPLCVGMDRASELRCLWPRSRTKCSAAWRNSSRALALWLQWSTRRDTTSSRVEASYAFYLLVRMLWLCWPPATHPLTGLRWAWLTRAAPHSLTCSRWTRAC